MSFIKLYIQQYRVYLSLFLPFVPSIPIIRMNTVYLKLNYQVLLFLK